ncbi:MAG: peptidylprolyl isomerase [Gammaproteobacteria bacterium]|nr:peptidylprolyl isomerase [Gammaproteobacteria bacterium]
MSISITRKGIMGVAVAIAMAGAVPVFADTDAPIPMASAASIEYLAQQRIKLGEPDTRELRSRIRKDLDVQRLLAMQASQRGLEKVPDVMAQVELNRLAVLSKAYLDEYFRLNPITDAAVAADYERRRKAGDIREYHVRHLSVTSEEQAHALLKKLHDGADLAQLARDNSSDPGANLNGGDIGWFRPDIFADEHFAAAVLALKKGETTTAPVKTRFGWHIIRVEDGPRNVADLPPYRELKPDLQKVMREKMMKRALENHIAALKQADTNARRADVTHVSRVP